MIRRLLAVLLMIMALPCSLQAQTVTFRSGEHPSFSRLVLTVPPGADWSMGRVGTGYGLQFSDPSVRFDIRGVFERIPRSRITDARVEDGTFVIDLGCACHATSFQFQANRLVIDIVDGSPPENALFETPLFADAVTESPVEPTLQNAQIVESLDASPNAQPRSLEIDGTVDAPDLDIGVAGGLPRVFSDIPARDIPIPSRLDEALESAPRVSEMEAALIEGLSRAASQGLLTPSLSSPAPLPTDSSDSTEIEIPDPPSSDAPAPDGIPGIIAHTSIDRDMPDAPADLTLSGALCLDEGLFDIWNWADERPFHDQLTELRAEVSTEAGDMDPEALMDLAKFYVHFGFGREALATLRGRTEAGNTDQIIEILALIVDEMPVTGAVLSGQEQCKTDVGLWATLATEHPTPALPENRNTLVQSLRRLPEPIRGHLGNRLAEKFSAIGDTETAEAFLIASGRNITTDQTMISRAQAQISEHEGDAGEAIETLEDLAENDARMPPRTLIQLIELKIEAGETVDSDLLSLSEVMRFENAADADLVGALMDVEIRGYLANSNPSTALAKLERTSDLAPDRRQALTARAVQGIVNLALDDEFLGFAFGDLPDIDAETENILARRLISLGFFDRANDVLATPARREAAKERRFIKAEIAIGSGRYNDVADILVGLTDDVSVDLRTRAAEAGGQHAAVLEVGSPGSVEDEALVAWRAESWPRLAASGVSPLSDIGAERSAVPLRDEQDALTPLAARRALIEDSRDTRELVSSLVDYFPVEAADQPAE